MNVKVPFALVFTDAVRTHVTDPLVRLRSTTSVLGSTLSGLPTTPDRCVRPPYAILVVGVRAGDADQAVR